MFKNPEVFPVEAKIVCCLVRNWKLGVQLSALENPSFQARLRALARETDNILKRLDFGSFEGLQNRGNSKIQSQIVAEFETFCMMILHDPWSRFLKFRIRGCWNCSQNYTRESLVRSSSPGFQKLSWERHFCNIRVSGKFPPEILNRNSLPGLALSGWAKSGLLSYFASKRIASGGLRPDRKAQWKPSIGSYTALPSLTFFRRDSTRTTDRRSKRRWKYIVFTRTPVLLTPLLFIRNYFCSLKNHFVTYRQKKVFSGCQTLIAYFWQSGRLGQKTVFQRPVELAQHYLRFFPANEGNWTIVWVTFCSRLSRCTCRLRPAPSRTDSAVFAK